MKKIIARLKREPVLTRAGLAAVLNVLVVSGLIDTGMSDAIQVAVVDVVGVGLALAARQKVTPVEVVQAIVADAPELARDASGIRDAIAHSRRHAAK